MIASTIGSKKFYLVAYTFWLILMSFACGWLSAVWFIDPKLALWPVLLSAAAVLMIFTRLARMLWTQHA
jgi:hypothetical protein